MKKFFIPLTLLLLAALAVTACSTATSVAPTAGVTTSTPLVGTSVPNTGGTAAPTGAATLATTPAATSAATSQATTAATTAPTSAASTASATAAATSAPESTSTTAATSVATSAATSVATSAATSSVGTATPAAGAGVTSTPVVVVPGQPGQYVRLSILLQSTLSTAQQSGRVTGVVVAQPLPQAGANTPTPAPDQLVPYVRYAVVDMNGAASSGAGETLVPFQLFTFTSSGTSQTFTLKGASSGLANAPAATLPANSGVLSAGWDSQQAQYWASQGIVIPVTGQAAQPDTEVLVRNSLLGTNMVGPQNQVIGSLSDILVDSTTGQFAYAVFSGGQVFGNRIFVVPVKNLIFQLDSIGTTGLGSIQLNFSPDVLNNAPFFNSLNIIPLDNTLSNLLNNFWQTVPQNSR
jgi:hypothetical protein